MSIGISLLLLAIGAILYFAVEASIQGLDLAVVGVILMAAGGLGLLISLIMMMSGRSRVYDDGSVVEERRRIR